MNSLKHVTRMAAHAAALVFGAFWLVATSAPAEPARDCFTGLDNPTRLQMVLGPIQSSTGTCGALGALDGVAPDSTLVFDLSKGSRPLDWGGACWGYETLALTGPTGVTVRAETNGYNWSGDALTAVRGSFALPGQPACRGDYWTLRLFPETPPEDGQLISPLDAGSGPWIVERHIGVEQAQFCGDTFVETGPVGCTQRFAVVSITELAP